MPEMHDGEVIAASRLVPECFEQIFDRHYDAVVGFAVGRIGFDEAHDVAAEVFVRAFDRRHLFRDDRETALPWLFGIASNVVRERRRRETRGATAMARVAGRMGEQSVGFEADATRRLDAQATRSALADALARLSDDEYEVLMLVALGEFTYDVMAENLGIPAGTVRSRLARARRRMRLLLEADRRMDGATP
jgi:RNA polymerase sigma factor (sigma-70 family)